MPRGPKGEKRPANVFEAAVTVGRIATGEVAETVGKAPARSKGGKAGGAARAAKLSEKQRREIAKKAAAKRWGK